MEMAAAGVAAAMETASRAVVENAATEVVPVALPTAAQRKARVTTAMMVAVVAAHYVHQVMSGQHGSQPVALAAVAHAQV